ncbi:hypothetical protein [Clostridium felsineum]|uniref:Uncharacterized protein n=1 Tax=Clostridium felsineum TaxID=36839 RepID=A0A1S8KXI7_9CLOT|nr:hypothetical protein [Clostridium felsineum]MCR3758381.1 hypothetical protein [Clostridium felsineum]URZ07952.1 hypothetical protein CLROS_033180 [Clostridium felsineum]URZ12983.1 hypothetical protein CROST_037330 [Clostridium felsineum]
MDFDVKRMLKLVTICDAIIAVIIFVVLLFITNYMFSIVMTLGVFTAALNFYLSTVTANFVLIKKKGTKSLILLSSIFRVILVGIISIVLCIIYKYYLIAYIGGYSAHFIALTIYGLLLKSNERK